MCGRFVLKAGEAEISAQCGVQEFYFQVSPRYNIAPTQIIGVILEENGIRKLVPRRWGLVPFWAKDPKIGSRMINARAETLAEKPSFKVALQQRRCLIPASGYYEWQQDGKHKIPTYIQLKDTSCFVFAGLWETWHSPTGDLLETCTIITVAPNELMAEIHNRMPAILTRETAKSWLAATALTPQTRLSLLRSYAAEKMECWPVSQRVNSAAVDDPQCLLPLA